MTFDIDRDESRTAAAYQPRTDWPALGAVAAVVAIFLVALAISSLAALALMRVGRIGSATVTSELLLLVSILSMQAVVVVLTLGAAGRLGTRRGTLALQPPAGGWRQVAKAFAGLVVIVTVVNFLGKLVAPGDMERDLAPFVAIAHSDLLWLCLIAVGIGAPLSEEIVFRGFLFSALAKTRLGFLGTAFVTSAAWTAMHAGYSVAGAFEVFLIGLYLSFVLLRTGSLWAPILCHGIYNSTLLALIAFAPVAPAG